MLQTLWSLLLVILTSSLVMTAPVHAEETLGIVTIECSGAMHNEGGADQSQSKSDKAVPHHHSTCHCPSLNVSATDELPAVARAVGMRPFPAPDSATALRIIDPALRPPIA